MSSASAGNERVIRQARRLHNQLGALLAGLEVLVDSVEELLEALGAPLDEEDDAPAPAPARAIRTLTGRVMLPD